MGKQQMNYLSSQTLSLHFIYSSHTFLICCPTLPSYAAPTLPSFPASKLPSFAAPTLLLFAALKLPSFTAPTLQSNRSQRVWQYRACVAVPSMCDNTKFLWPYPACVTIQSVCDHTQCVAVYAGGTVEDDGESWPVTWHRPAVVVEDQCASHYQTACSCATHYKHQ